MLSWIHDPGGVILRRAGRAALTVPLTFALVNLVTDNSQASVFAAFGSFALIAFADFGGNRAPRTSAYVITALFGAPLIAIGTALSGSLLAATAVTLVVVFAVRFAGALGGYSEAAGVTLILGFVLAVALDAPLSELGWRLIGWFAAALIAALASLVLWPHRERGVMLGKVAGACRDLAGAVRDGSLNPGLESGAALEEDYAGLPYRPAGPWERYRAFRQLCDELLRAHGYLPLAPDTAPADAELRRECSEVLVSTADRIDGDGATPDLIELEAARKRHRQAGIRAANAALAAGTSAEAVLERIEAQFRLRLLSYTALSLAANAIVTTGGSVPPSREFEFPPEVAESTGAGGTLRNLFGLLRAQLTPRSARLHDAARLGAGLAVAVFVALVADISHAFWVVLATLLLLRTDALGTGSSAVQAILGTTAGFVLASLLMIAVGDAEPVLWALMPLAAFLAAYTPTAVRFIVGQGAFTLFVVVLFNLVEPDGWRVALIRLEDVAIGAGVSLVIGFLLWPRGAGVVLRESIAEATRLGSRYLATAFAAVLGDRDQDAALEAERGRVLAATNRSSEALSQHLGEPGVHLPNRTWDALLAMPRQLRGTGDLLLVLAGVYGRGGGGAALAEQADEVAERYAALSMQLAGEVPATAKRSSQAPREDTRGAAQIGATPAGTPPHAAEARAEVVAALEAGGRDDGNADTAARLTLTYEWIEFLNGFAERSTAPVAEAAASAARPWWR